MIDNEVSRRLFLPHLEHPTREDAEKPDSTYVAVNVLPVPWVSPGDVSNVVTFLASDASEHLTGTPHPRRCRLPDQEMTQIRPVVGPGMFAGAANDSAARDYAVTRDNGGAGLMRRRP